MESLLYGFTFPMFLAKCVSNQAEIFKLVDILVSADCFLDGKVLVRGDAIFSADGWSALSNLPIFGFLDSLKFLSEWRKVGGWEWAHEPGIND